MVNKCSIFAWLFVAALSAYLFFFLLSEYSTSIEQTSRQLSPQFHSSVGIFRRYSIVVIQSTGNIQTPLIYNTNVTIAHVQDMNCNYSNACACVRLCFSNRNRISFKFQLNWILRIRSRAASCEMH